MQQLPWQFDFVRFSVVVLTLKIGMIHFPKYLPPQLKLRKTQAESDEVISCGKPITAIVGLPPIFVLRIAFARPGVLKCTAVVGGGGNWQESGSLDLNSTSCRLQLCHLGLWWQLLQYHLGGNLWQIRHYEHKSMDRLVYEKSHI